MAKAQNPPAQPALKVATLVQEVEIETLLSLCEALAAQQGIEKVGGLSIREWFQQQKATHVEALLKQSTDPATVAKFRSILEECKKPVGEDGKVTEI